MKCSVLFEMVAAVLGRLKLWFFGSSLDCMKVSLFRLLGVLIEFFVKDVSCLSRFLASLRRMLLFLPSKMEFYVEYRCLLMLDLSPTNRYLCSYSGFIRALMSTVRALSRKVSEDWLMDGGSRFFIGIDMSCLARSFSVFALHGVFPVSIS